MKPSVCLFCASFTSGGVEKVLINLANFFCRENYATSFLVCQNIGELSEHLNSNVEIYSLDKRLSNSFWPALKQFRKMRPDVVICGPQFVNILSVIILKFILKSATKLIVTHHSFYDIDVKQMGFISRFYKSFIRVFYNYADKIVVVSNAVKHHLVTDIGVSENKITVVYNPVINDDFEQLSYEKISHKWFIENKPYKILVCVGRLSKIKNQEALIRLMPQLIKQKECKLLIIGDGEQKEYLKKLVSDLSISDYVDFLGTVSNPLRFVRLSDLLVLPSVTETFSLVAVEAIAMGVPVLSTPTLGVKEILSNCKGCFFKAIDKPEEFAQKISEILKAPNIFVDKHFVDKFKVNAIGKQYELLANEV